jgi:hypothetical protein
MADPMWSDERYVEADEAAVGADHRVQRHARSDLDPCVGDDGEQVRFVRDFPLNIEAAGFAPRGWVLSGNVRLGRRPLRLSIHVWIFPSIDKRVALTPEAVRKAQTRREHERRSRGVREGGDSRGRVD